MAESRAALYGAMAANAAIATTKFIVAGITGSSAMLSEGIHSLVDTGDSILLLVGKHRSLRPPSPEHPFGHGKELYFWSLIVGVLIFGLGGGVSLYEGIQHVREPHPLKDAHWSYIVLGLAAVFEGISFTIAWRAFRRERGDAGFWEALHRSKDPTVFTVVVEDGAALLGLAVAALGVFCSHQLQMPRLDGVASIVIGLLLAGVAVLLARETKGLLIGEPARSGIVERVADIVMAKEWITGVNHVRTIHSSPRQVFVAISADFRDDLTMGEAETLIEALESELRAAIPELRSIYIRPEKASCAVDFLAGPLGRRNPA
jgi:cation diffusion facilitator family transporter